MTILEHEHKFKQFNEINLHVGKKAAKKLKLPGVEEGVRWIKLRRCDLIGCDAMEVYPDISDVDERLKESLKNKFNQTVIVDFKNK